MCASTPGEQHASFCDRHAVVPPASNMGHDMISQRGDRKWRQLARNGGSMPQHRRRLCSEANKQVRERANDFVLSIIYRGAGSPGSHRRRRGHGHQRWRRACAPSHLPCKPRELRLEPKPTPALVPAHRGCRHDHTDPVWCRERERERELAVGTMVQQGQVYQPGCSSPM